MASPAPDLDEGAFWVDLYNEVIAAEQRALNQLISLSAKLNDGQRRIVEDEDLDAIRAASGEHQRRRACWLEIDR